MKNGDKKFTIDEICALVEMNKRTVRYYIQERLLPPPLGVGRGRHYGRQHLEALLKVKSLQEAGRTLEEIRGTLSGKQPDLQMAPAPGAPVRSVWRRFTLAPGIELHVAGEVSAPSAAQLERLAALCRVHVGPKGEPEHGDD